MVVVPASRKRATNVSLEAALIDEARVLGINLSRACERGLSSEIARVRRERWLSENAAAIDAYNSRIDANGLTLAKYRRL